MVRGRGSGEEETALLGLAVLVDLVSEPVYLVHRHATRRNRHELRRLRTIRPRVNATACTIVKPPPQRRQRRHPRGEEKRARRRLLCVEHLLHLREQVARTARRAVRVWHEVGVLVREPGMVECLRRPSAATPGRSSGSCARTTARSQTPSPSIHCGSRSPRQRSPGMGWRKRGRRSVGGNALGSNW